MAGYKPKDMEDKKIGVDFDVKPGECTQKFFSKYKSCVTAEVEEMIASPKMSEWCARYKTFLDEHELYGFNSHIELGKAIEKILQQNLPYIPSTGNPLLWNDSEQIEIQLDHEMGITTSGPLGLCQKELWDKVERKTDLLCKKIQQTLLHEIVDFPMHNHCMPDYQLPLGADNSEADLV